MAAADNHALAGHLADKWTGGWQGRHGAVSWDQDSDVLCAHQNMCSFVPDNSTAAGHWWVSLSAEWVVFLTSLYGYCTVQYMP